MSDRFLKILVGVLAVLAVAYGLARVLADRGDGARGAPFKLAAAAETDLDSMIVASAADTLRLRGGTDWTVNGYEAVPDAAAALQRALEEAELDGMVSRNPENHARLGVAAGQGRRVTLFAGTDTALALIVGDKGRTPDDVYVRRPDDDAVYVLEGTLVDLLRREADDWRNRQLVAADRPDIGRIEIEYPQESLTLVRDSAGWSLEPSGRRADESAASRLLGQLAGLRAIGFAADSVADTLSWTDPIEVRVLGPDGTALARLQFRSRGEDGYYVRRPGKDVVYTVSRFTGNEILKREEDLIATEDAESG